MSLNINYPNIDTNIAIAHAGESVGNVDPRFGDKFDVAASRMLLQAALPEIRQTYVLKPRSGVDYIDVDKVDDPRVEVSHDQKETDVVGDALVTNRRNVGLMLNTADCIPLVVSQPERNILSLIHLGWKGAAFRLHDDIFEYMTEEHKFDPLKAIAYLGPSIASNSYITPELHPIQAEDPDWKAHVTESDRGYHIDVAGFVISCLRVHGVPEKNIHFDSSDTGMLESGYYSFTRYKRDNVPNGRNGFVVALV